MGMVNEDFFYEEIKYKLSQIDVVSDDIFNLYKNEIFQFGDKRKKEYLKSRELAHSLFSEIGISDFILLNDDKRAPIWPSGIVGSISHSSGFAIVAISKDHKSIGIDLEKIMSDERSEKLKDQFLTEEEIKINQLDFNLFSTIVFSAKESLFKLIYPLCREYFGFHSAKIREITDSGFSIELKSQSTSVSKFNGLYQGKWQKLDDIILTSLVIPKSD